MKSVRSPGWTNARRNQVNTPGAHLHDRGRMKLPERLKRPPWSTVLLFFIVLGALGVVYLLWSPGKRIRDGRHDLGTNGIWLQHGWLGDNAWFERNRRDTTLFRSERRIRELADLLTRHGITYVFPHLCPCSPTGEIAPVDADQAELFLDQCGSLRVVPWIGGVLGRHCFPASSGWRRRFIASVADLLAAHPGLAGVQVNIEPMPSGTRDFLVLLDELRAAMPAGKILSVAAYPPPTRWHPFPNVHWDETYFREVARRVDQVAPMMYDTAIRVPKCYQRLMHDWTLEILAWSGDTQVLLGVPVYDDPGVGYHFAHVENLRNALRGIHAGLSAHATLPRHYAGIAIYCEWEMDQDEWQHFRREFARTP